MKYLDKANLWRQKIRLQVGMRLTINEHEGLLWGDENNLSLRYGDGDRIW